MDTGNSTVRNLLYIVLVLVLLSTLSNFYVATQLARHSEQLASLQRFLANQMMGSALTQAQELEKRMDSLNQAANGIDGKIKQAEVDMDAKLQKAQDDFILRLRKELPGIMEDSIRKSVPSVERQLQKRGVPIP